ncbi:MAG: hypothetical protein ACXWNI_06850, partial [Candidatus Limnocylindrales bacterium]
MSLRRGPRGSGDPVIPGRVRRSLVGGVIIAVILAACGSSSTPAASQTAQPSSAAPIVAASSSPAASAAPTESPTASPTATATADSGTLALAGLSSVLDAPAQTVDTSTFATTFASETPAIYVIYQLTPGSSGKVVSTWNKGDVVVNTVSFDYPASGPWAWFELTYKDGFIPGDYEVVLKVLDTESTVTLPFTITGPRKAPPAPTPVPSGTSAFTLLSMATFADSTKSGPDSTKFTDTFPTTAPQVYVVFSLRPGLSGKVVCTMTANGSDVIKPITLSYGSGVSWGDFKISTGGNLPVGDYVATLTYAPSGEVVTIPFTV